MTPESRFLQDLARRCAAPFIANPACQAALLAGSAAEGIADRFSDIDLIVYWEAFPDAATREAARGGAPVRWQIGADADARLIEALDVEGVEVQIAQVSIAAWEEDMAAVLERLEVDSPLQKALDGLLKGLPLHGEDRIAHWRGLAVYPDALARAMIERHLDLFPLWALPHRLAGDDAVLWRHQLLVESAHKLLAVLAGLNRRYFSPFQFKRLAPFCAGLEIAPPRFAERIRALFAAPPERAFDALAELVAETIDLVEAHAPPIDTSGVRARLARRAAPWLRPE